MCVFFFWKSSIWNDDESKFSAFWISAFVVRFQYVFAYFDLPLTLFFLFAKTKHRIQLHIGHRVVVSLRMVIISSQFSSRFFFSQCLSNFRTLFLIMSQLFLTLVNLRVGAPPNERPFGLPI